MSSLFKWWKRRHVGNTEEAETSREALDDAKAALDAAQRAEPEIIRIGEELRRLRRENHFSPLVQEAIRRHKEAS